MSGTDNQFLLSKFNNGIQYRQERILTVYLLVTLDMQNIFNLIRSQNALNAMRPNFSLFQYPQIIVNKLLAQEVWCHET